MKKEKNFSRMRGERGGGRSNGSNRRTRVNMRGETKTRPNEKSERKMGNIWLMDGIACFLLPSLSRSIFHR